MTARWTDDQFKNVRRVDRPARDDGSTAGRTHAERTAAAGVGPHSAAESPGSAGTHGGRVTSSRPSAVPPRQKMLRWPLVLSFVLLLIGAVSCHHEADGSPFCAEVACEVEP